ncbi:MAG: hypothetical protein N3B10_15360, partial [Armatimonadetes bacterium]|nr:hypothetical protein [Armatimonadota bacterium]
MKSARFAEFLWFFRADFRLPLQNNANFVNPCNIGFQSAQNDCDLCNTDFSSSLQNLCGEPRMAQSTPISLDAIELIVRHIVEEFHP